jgi:hypothetical protein
MKYIITESQRRRLLNEQKITDDGYVRVSTPGKVGILRPDGEITLVPDGTKITKVADENTKPGKGSFFHHLEWNEKNPEWVPTAEQLQKILGVPLGLGPTVVRFNLPNGEEYTGWIKHDEINKKGVKPDPTKWYFLGYYPNDDKKEKVPLPVEKPKQEEILPYEEKPDIGYPAEEQ